MNENATYSLKSAHADVEKLAAIDDGAPEGAKDQRTAIAVRLIGSAILNVVAAILHQWDASAKIRAGRND